MLEFLRSLKKGGLDSVIHLSKSRLLKQDQISIHGKFYSKAEDVYSQSNLDYYSENTDDFINFYQNNCISSIV